MDNPFLCTIQNNTNIPYTPVWLMRQAGRYLPEYRNIREKAGSFMSLCTNPELACEVTLQPLRRFNLDAAILFSDILVIPDAMGLGLHFIENEGPKFTNPICNNLDVDNLTTHDILDKLSFVFSTIQHIKNDLNANIPLIGFSGAPFTLACYMLEGGGSSNYDKIKKWLITNPDYSHRLLEKITDVVIIYLNAQITAGVDTIMLFDTWGGVLTENLYLEFSLPYIKKIINALEQTKNQVKVPSIVFTKGGGVWMEHLSELNASAFGIDWTINIAKAKKVLGNKVLQGNLDPVILAVGDRSSIKKEVSSILHNYVQANDGCISGHIFNLGHGVLPFTNPDNVAYLVDMVHEVSSKIR